MQFTITQFAVLAVVFGIAQAAPAPVAVAFAPAMTDPAKISLKPNAISKRGVPASKGTTALSAAKTILPGQKFDGGMVMFDRGRSCTGQVEGGNLDAVFVVKAGGTLSNVIIGPNQVEGVHCEGGCTLQNVWWSDVCEDALTVEKSQTAGQITRIIGGGAFNAADKVFQHNGAGTLSISDFTVENFGKLYRSCGNCGTQYKRNIIMNNINASGGKSLTGINSNYGDTCRLTNINAKNVKETCAKYEGTTINSQEPVRLGEGPDGVNCIYAMTDVKSS
ncbi:hypothetical protein DID88_006935 [Monilinia fructigena]|uniref:Pectate lyase n=1 Tax=Monilinia fructigena TaxID=38457 RepID=A0A395IGH5_9HELO|nr:hypothetical protein DID88_006935 [Monilinia fructigena]